jgi:hypothetical protein
VRAIEIEGIIHGRPTQTEGGDMPPSTKPLNFPKALPLSELTFEPGRKHHKNIEKEKPSSTVLSVQLDINAKKLPRRSNILIAFDF